MTGRKGLMKKKEVGIIIALVIFILFTMSGLEEIPVVVGILTAVHFKHFAELVIRVIEKV